MIEAAGILFLSPEGRVLLLQRSNEGDAAGLWAIPGGKIEEGENAESAAVREVEEETGYKCKEPGDLFFRRIKDDVDYTTFIQKVSEEFIPKLNDEHTAFAWVTPTEVLKNAGYV